MQDRKLRREKNKTEIKKEENMKKSKPGLNVISRVFVVLLAVLVIAVFVAVIYLKVLPNKYLIPVSASVVILLAGAVLLVFRKKASNTLKMIMSTLSIILIAVFLFVGMKLVRTLSFLGNMTTQTVNAKTYSVVVLKDSQYTKLEDVQYRLLLYYDNELNSNQAAIDKLIASITVVTETTDDVHELANKLLANEVDAILVEDSHYPIIEEEHEDFKETTKVIYTFTMEDTIETIAKDVSVTKEPFNVFISGIDAYGKISAVSRSDVNMVISVNPQTKQILLVNMPRDFYVKLNGTSGYRDKLTHAGIYGIDKSVKTVEDLLDTDINYYVRVNFSSLIDIINAIGGVEVYSEYEFTSVVGKYHFVKGYNHLDGHKALGFARERYSFAQGDRQRGQNQQAVISAAIRKICSSSTILTRFDALLDSLEGSFQTNMEYTKMIEIVRMQISDGATWNISSISLDGIGSMERTYSMGKRLLSVLIPYAGNVKQAQNMIQQVLDGQMLEEGAIDLTKYNDYPVVSRGVYEEEQEEEESEEVPETETPTTETPGTDKPGTETPGTDTPSTDKPGTETPGTDTPSTETPGTDEPGTETPGTDTPSTDTPSTDKPGTETPGADTPSTETPVVETGAAEV